MLFSNTFASPEKGKPIPIRSSDFAVVANNSMLPNGIAIPKGAVAIFVSVQEQRAIVARDGIPFKSCLISTATAGVGSRNDSGRTPLGWHKVSERIGRGARPGQVFISRKPNGGVIPCTKWENVNGEDKVLTRILWLDGMENGKNRGNGVDSHSRFIYLHGTNQEHLLGKPASHGCIRFSNRDIIDLFEEVADVPTYCLIMERFQDGN